MKVALATVGALCLLALLTWLLWSGLNMNSARFDRELKALGDFTRFERGISREVLTARAGLSRNYDGLVRLADAYDDALARLRETTASDPEESAAVEILAARVRRHQELIEQFKTKNALLQNSFAYFYLFGARLAASDDKAVVVAASALGGCDAAPHTRYVRRQRHARSRRSWKRCRACKVRPAKQIRSARFLDTGGCCMTFFPESMPS